jgi:hypothetical protein
MAINGVRRAKPSFIPMSTAEWDALSESRQQALISSGKSSAELPVRPIVATPPIEIQSPKAKALLERIAQGKEHTYALQQLWISLELCQCAPDPRQFGIWFYKHEFEVISDAFSETAVWMSKLRQKDPAAAVQRTHDDKVKYASAVMNGMVKSVTQTTVNRTFADGTELPPDWDALDASEKRKLIAIHKGGGDE